MNAGDCIWTIFSGRNLANQSAAIETLRKAFTESKEAKPKGKEKIK
jgi:hypothetical protein